MTDFWNGFLVGWGAATWLAASLIWWIFRHMGGRK